MSNPASNCQGYTFVVFITGSHGSPGYSQYTPQDSPPGFGLVPGGSWGGFLGVPGGRFGADLAPIWGRIGDPPGGFTKTPFTGVLTLRTILTRVWGG